MEIVGYENIQFAKAPNVLYGVELAHLSESEKAIKELADRGMLPIWRDCRELIWPFTCLSLRSLMGHAIKEPRMLKTLLSRRAAFAALSIPAANALTSPAHAAPLPDTGAFRDVCFLTPQSIEGPYYLDPRLVRAQIAEDRMGVPLRVDLRVIDGATCKPSERARVDIWHADALGIYSGYEGQSDKQDVSTVGQKFLRGTQFTDSKGAVRFETIYPGWYVGRATHIHFKVLLDNRDVLTGQMYFPDAETNSSTRTFPPIRTVQPPARWSMPMTGSRISTIQTG